MKRPGTGRSLKRPHESPVNLAHGHATRGPDRSLGNSADSHFDLRVASELRFRLSRTGSARHRTEAFMDNGSRRDKRHGPRRHAAARSRVAAGALSVCAFLALGASMAARSVANATSA